MERTRLQVALEDNLLFEMYAHGKIIHEGNKRVAAILRILAHRNANIRILEIGAGTASATREILSALKGENIFRMYKEYVFTDVTPSFLQKAAESLKDYQGITYATFDMERPPSEQEVGNRKYDVLVASNVIHAASDVLRTMHNLRNMLNVGGKIILLEITRPLLFAALLLGTFSDIWNGNLDPNFPRQEGPFMDKDTWDTILTQSGFSGLDFALDDYAGQPLSTVLVATATELPSLPKTLGFLPSNGITVVRRGAGLGSTSIDPFIDFASNHGYQIDLLPLISNQIPKYTSIWCLLELERPLFENVDDQEWTSLQGLIHSAEKILWISNGGIHSGRDPTYAMFGGIARALKNEQNQMQISVLDLDDGDFANNSDSWKTVLEVWKENVAHKYEPYNMEYRHKDWVVYRGCLQPGDSPNKQWQSNTTEEERMQLLPLRALVQIPLRLGITQPRVLNTIYFQQNPDFELILPADYVEIKVFASGINNKDISVLSGSFHSDTSSSECAGIIARVGKEVTGFQEGDNVFCVCFGRSGNFARVRASFCQMVEDSVNYAEMVTMPLAFCTAIHALGNIARLSSGETVLIQSATGGVGNASVQIAVNMGAIIYATVETAEKRQILLDSGFGIKPENVFLSRTKCTAQRIKARTGGKGVDVILFSSNGEFMHEYWNCLAKFGRFIDVGRVDVMEGGQLDMQVFSGNATFSFFDMEDISKERPDILSGLMRSLKILHQEGKMKPPPSKVFDISNIEKACKYFETTSRTGKVVISFGSEDCVVKFQKSPYKSEFDPEAAYLLVGCLGGLGRVLIRWMLGRGARHMVFLSRSGGDDPGTQEFLAQLHTRQVSTQVIKGDVACFDDVKKAVDSSTKPIKGVVQGALNLQVCINPRLQVPCAFTYRVYRIHSSKIWPLPPSTKQLEPV